jgi:hypothetical protein
MTTKKTATSFYLSGQAHAILERLADRLGISRVGVLEASLRRMYRAETGEDPGPPAKRRPRGRPRKGGRRG